MEDESWESVTEEEWEELAQLWLSELRSDTSALVTEMNFTARPALQWQFILKAVKYAESDNDLFAIAAGPVEHLLGWHGPDFIAEVEKQAAEDPKFSRLLTGVWKYNMNEEVWTRLQAIVEKVERPEQVNEEETTSDEYHEELFRAAVVSIVHLLGIYGADFMALVEKQAAENPAFARLLPEVRCKDADQSIWMRLQAIGTRFAPQRSSSGNGADNEIK